MPAAAFDGYVWIDASRIRPRSHTLRPCTTTGNTITTTIRTTTIRTTTIRTTARTTILTTSRTSIGRPAGDG
jgi:hypothetical protein